MAKGGAPTKITLSASQTLISYWTPVHFTINTDGSNVPVYLNAYNSYSAALNASSQWVKGELLSAPVQLDASGKGSAGFAPATIGPDTYWVAVYGSVKSNIVEVKWQTVEPTYLTLSASGTPSEMTFTITSNPETYFKPLLKIFSNYENALNAPPWDEPSPGLIRYGDIVVVNGKYSGKFFPSMISKNTQYWVAVYQTSDGKVLRSNIITVEQG